MPLSAKVSKNGWLCQHRWSETGSGHSLASHILKFDPESLIVEPEVNVTSPQVVSVKPLTLTLGKARVIKLFSRPSITERIPFVEDSYLERSYLESCSLLPDILVGRFSRD